MHDFNMIDKLDDIVNKYNNETFWCKIKHIYYSSKEINDVDPEPKIGDVFEYQNIKKFLEKAMFQINLKKFWWFKKVKNTMPWTNIISYFKGEEIVGRFYEKELQKTNKNSLELKK